MTESEVDGPQPVDDDQPEWRRRLLAAAADHARRRAQADQWRQELAERRQHGLAARQRQKLARSANQTPEEDTVPTTTASTATATPERKQRCRLLHQNKRGALDRCVNEVADEQGEIALCVAHLGDAMRLLNRHAANTLRSQP